MTAPSSEQGLTYLAQTCIEPDRLAHVVCNVSQEVQGGFPRAFIAFEGAALGRLTFSVRARFVRAELLTFDVVIACRDDGFTSLSTTFIGRSPERGISTLGLAIYKRYVRELAGALAQFDPMSTAVLIDRTARPRRQPQGSGR